MQISESIIHSISKEKETSGPQSVQINLRDENLITDERLETLGEDLLNLYGKLANSYGTMNEASDIHRFPKFLTQFYNSNFEFLEFSKKVTTLLSEAMASQRFTTTSYPIFFKYRNQRKDWLLIAMLKLKEGVGIDEATLNLNDSMFFDISNLREAARIDLEKWHNNTQPYLSFIKKGSGSDAESSRYFRDALSCLDYTDAKVNTQNSIDALDDYSEIKEWSPERRQQARAKAHEYFKEKKDAGESVNIIAMSAYIDDQEPEAFAEYVRESDHEINETFSPDPNTFRRLKRLSSRFGTISLGFEVLDLTTDRIYYNAQENAIVVSNPPPELIDSIRKAKGDSIDQDD